MLVRVVGVAGSFRAGTGRGAVRAGPVRGAVPVRGGRAR
jgi:hypothetical protein